MLLLLLPKVIGLGSFFFFFSSLLPPSEEQSIRNREDIIYILSCPHLQAGGFEVEGKDITVGLHPYRFGVEVGEAIVFFLNHHIS